MKLPHLTAIAAMSTNRTIGKDGTLPWHCPEDLKFFKAMTLGSPILMGRKTWESFKKPLPGRTSIVLSSTMETTPDVFVIRNLSELWEITGNRRTFIIGGASLFEVYLQFCDDFYLTEIGKEFDGDTFMPAFENMFDLGLTLPLPMVTESRIQGKLGPGPAIVPPLPAKLHHYTRKKSGGVIEEAKRIQDLLFSLGVNRASVQEALKPMLAEAVAKYVAQAESTGSLETIVTNTFKQLFYNGGNLEDVVKDATSKVAYDFIKEYVTVRPVSVITEEK